MSGPFVISKPRVCSEGDEILLIGNGGPSKILTSFLKSDHPSQIVNRVAGLCFQYDFDYYSERIQPGACGGAIWMIWRARIFKATGFDVGEPPPYVLLAPYWHHLYRAVPISPATHQPIILKKGTILSYEQALAYARLYRGRIHASCVATRPLHRMGPMIYEDDGRLYTKRANKRGIDKWIAVSTGTEFLITRNTYLCLTNPTVYASSLTTEPGDGFFGIMRGEDQCLNREGLDGPIDFDDLSYLASTGMNFENRLPLLLSEEEAVLAASALAHNDPFQEYRPCPSLELHGMLMAERIAA
jgi:hypothetical protein